MTEARHQRFEIDIEEIERQLRASADMAPASKPDPLAELARIVGQNDPFRGILGDRATSARPAGGAPAEPRPAEPQFREPAFEDPYVAPAHAAPAAGGYDPVAETYGSEDASFDQEDMQPLRQHRSRGRLAAVLALLVVAAGATAGGLYWKRSGRVYDASGNPPVITADKTPLKVAPENPGGVEVPDQNKQIYDRKAQDGQSRVVDNREQPVDVREAVRSMPPASGPSSTPSPTATPRSGQSGAVSSALGEPKRVRTVAIKPDGSPFAAPGQPTASDAGVNLMPGDAPPPVAVPTMTIPTRPGAASTPTRNMAAVPATTPAPTQPSAMPDLQPAAPAATDPGTPAGPTISVLPPRRPKLADADSAAPVAADRPKPADKPADAAEEKGNFNVQVAVRDSDAGARTAWTELLDKYPGDLEGRPARVSEAQVSGKTVYRVRVGPYSKQDANALCTKLKKSGGKCFVASN